MNGDRPLEIIESDPSVFGRRDVVPSNAPGRRPLAVLALVAALSIVGLAWSRSSGSGHGASAATSSTVRARVVTPTVAPPPAVVGAPAAADEDYVAFALSVHPATITRNVSAVAEITGQSAGLQSGPLLFTLDQDIRGDWRTVAYLVGAPTPFGPFRNAAVFGTSAAPPPSEVVPIGVAADPAFFQINGIEPGSYRVCRTLTISGLAPPTYVCAPVVIDAG